MTFARSHDLAPRQGTGCRRVDQPDRLAGQGRPTVPALRLPDSGLTVLAHDPSDSPYPR